jgi:hypothetical protein
LGVIKAFGWAAALYAPASADAKYGANAGSGGAAKLAFAMEPCRAEAWTVGVGPHVRLYTRQVVSTHIPNQTRSQYVLHPFMQFHQRFLSENLH